MRTRASCFICAALWADPAVRSTASASTLRTAAPGRRTARWPGNAAAGRVVPVPNPYPAPVPPPLIFRRTASRRWDPRNAGSSGPVPRHCDSLALRCSPDQTWLKVRGHEFKDIQFWLSNTDILKSFPLGPNNLVPTVV